MKSASRAIVFSLIALLACVVWAAVMASLSGCNADQLNGFSRSATTAQTQLVGSATQPANPIVTTTEAIYPPATPWIGIAGSVLGIVATGVTVAAKWETSDAKHAVQEVIGDVKAWNQPNVAWSSKTEKIVRDAAGIVAAAPVPPATATPPASAT